MPDALDIRTLTSDDDLPEWLRATSTGFMRSTPMTEEEVAKRREGIALDRTQGAYDGARCVGTFRSFTQWLTVPGGATLPACAISQVTVTPTHRRRGLLTRMMRRALDAARDRGEAMASLIAAEYPIYGRYGFGPAAQTAEFEVDVARSGVDARYGGPPEGGGRVDLVDEEEVRRVGPGVHERFRVQPQRQGAIDRTDYWWRMHTGLLRLPDRPSTPPFHAVFRDADGVPQGLAAYVVHDRWEGNLPHNTAEVVDLVAATPKAERALWHFLLSVDWVAKVTADNRPPDDVLPLLLPDPRAARMTTVTDYLWLRPLDVPRMLQARTYQAPGTLVLDLRDEAGYAGGRYRLEAGPDGATCAATRDDPDLSMEVGELGALFLGDESAVRLAALGRVEEHREGAAVRADALLRTSRRPWCPDMF